MFGIDAIGNAVSAIAGVGKEWLKGRNDEKKETRQMKHKLALAKIDAQIAAVQSAQKHEQNWEIIALKQRAQSIMDDLAFIVLLLSIICCFVPYTQPFMVQGVELLDSFPLWYKSLIAAAFAVTFGYRPLAGMFNKGK